MTEFSAGLDQRVLAQARNRLGQFVKRLEADATRALAIGAEDGAAALRAGLLAAHTITGEHREMVGRGVPGRYETGTMYDAIKTDADTPYYDGDRIEISFGWFPEDYQDYFKMQEEGSDDPRIPAANAFPRAIQAAIQGARRAFEEQGLRV